MAFDKTLIIPVYLAASGAGNLLKISASAKTLLPVAGENCKSSAGAYTSRKNAFVWGGNFFIPFGRGTDDSSHFVGYLNSPNEVAHILGYYNSIFNIVPMGDKVAFLGYDSCAKGPTPFYLDGPSFAKAGQPIRDFATIDDYLIFVQYAGSYAWKYPFTSAPASLSGTLNFMQALAELKGSLYAIAYIDSSNVALLKFTGTSWIQVGSNYNVGGAWLSNDNRYYSLFQFNEKLRLVIGQTAIQRIRCFEINEVTGVFTDKDSDIPSALKAAPTTYSPVFEVIDDTGSSRKVFIFVMYNGSAGWYLYEFADGSVWTLINSGSETFSPPWGHILWDEDAKGVEIVSALQNPSGHIDMDIKASDLKFNGGVNIKPKFYKTADATEFPPYTECTEQTGVGSEGKTALSSKPSGIITLANLSDDFGDGIINSDLWEIVNASIKATAFTRDNGIGYGYYPNDHTITEGASKLLFPPGAITPADEGMGLKSKWWISGEFQVDVVLQNLANLKLSGSTDYYALILYIKERAQKGYGIAVFTRTGPLPKAKPFVFQNNIEPGTKGSDSTATLADGQKIRISRNGANVWTLKADPDGANETLVLGTNPAYSGPVQIWLFGITFGIPAHWSIAAPGCGFGPLVVSGAGSLGKFDGSFEHYFAWDAVSDIGGGYGGVTRLLISGS